VTDVHCHRLERVQRVPRSLVDTFAFFTDAENLEAITPPFLGFDILTPRPVHMGAGTLLDYRLRLFGVPFSWRTRIEVFEPSRRFSDVQVRGPYRRWHHLHEFHAIEDGTLVVDRIDYEVPLGPLGSLAHGLVVGRTLTRIFDHRRQQVARLLGGDDGT
jgi:ligand-binding SRPBCC domain-containing protein